MNIAATISANEKRKWAVVIIIIIIMWPVMAMA